MRALGAPSQACTCQLLDTCSPALLSGQPYGVALNHASKVHQHGVGTLRLHSDACADLENETTMQSTFQAKITKARTTDIG